LAASNLGMCTFCNQKEYVMEASVNTSVKTVNAVRPRLRRGTGRDGR
jgi:hypothetical protein